MKYLKNILFEREIALQFAIPKGNGSSSTKTYKPRCNQSILIIFYAYFISYMLCYYFNTFFQLFDTMSHIKIHLVSNSVTAVRPKLQVFEFCLSPFWTLGLPSINKILSDQLIGSFPANWSKNILMFFNFLIDLRC